MPKIFHHLSWLPRDRGSESAPAGPGRWWGTAGTSCSWSTWWVNDALYVQRHWLVFSWWSPARAAFAELGCGRSFPAWARICPRTPIRPRYCAVPPSSPRTSDSSNRRNHSRRSQFRSTKTRTRSLYWKYLSDFCSRNPWEQSSITATMTASGRYLGTHQTGTENISGRVQRSPVSIIIDSLYSHFATPSTPMCDLVRQTSSPSCPCPRRWGHCRRFAKAPFCSKISSFHINWLKTSMWQLSANLDTNKLTRHRIQTSLTQTATSHISSLSSRTTSPSVLRTTCSFFSSLSVLSAIFKIVQNRRHEIYTYKCSVISFLLHDSREISGSPSDDEKR